MPTLIRDFNFGSALKNENRELARQLDEMYTTLALAINTKSSKYVTNGVQRPHVNPPASSQFNMNWEIGDVYVRSDSDTAWIMTSRTTSEDAVWTQIT